MKQHIAVLSVWPGCNSCSSCSGMDPVWKGREGGYGDGGEGEW